MTARSAFRHRGPFGQRRVHVVSAVAHPGHGAAGHAASAPQGRCGQAVSQQHPRSRAAEDGAPGGLSALGSWSLSEFDLGASAWRVESHRAARPEAVYFPMRTLCFNV